MSPKLTISLPYYRPAPTPADTRHAHPDPREEMHFHMPLSKGFYNEDCVVGVAGHKVPYSYLHGYLEQTLFLGLKEIFRFRSKRW